MTLSTQPSLSLETAARPGQPGNPSGGTTSTATRTAARAGATYLPIEEHEPILRGDDGEISLLVADDDLSLTHAGRAAGERVTGPHVHDHAEAFYVLEGELAFELGAERETITIGAGGLVAAPAGVAHSFGTAGDRPARWLVIHARDGGFAAFMRGIRDRVEVDWDIAPVPADGGLPVDRAVVSRPAERADGTRAGTPGSTGWDARTPG